MDNKNLLSVATAMLLLSSLQALGAESGQAKCGLTLYGEIDLQLTDGNVRVPVSLNGHQGLMTLNIASALTLLSQDAVREAQLPKSRWSGLLPEIHVNDKPVTELAKVASFKLGPVPFGKAEFLISPEVPSASSKTVSFGFMGIDLFQHLDLEVDLSRRKLRLFSQDHCAGKVVYWTNTFASAPLRRGNIGNYYFPMEIDGKKVEATLAPGQRTTTLNTDISRKLYGFDEKSPGVETLQDDDDDTARHEYRAMRLTAPGLNVTNSKIRLMPPRKGCTVETAGRPGGGAGYANCEGAFPLALGMNVLSQLRFYIATKENVLYFSAADAGMPATADTP